MVSSEIVLPPEIFCGIAISPDGTKKAAITNYGSLFISSSPGNWTVNQSAPFYFRYLSSLAYMIHPQNNQISIDNSGKYISVSQEGLGVFTSSNGTDFKMSLTVPIGSWKSIAMSSNGQYQIVISENAGCYKSTNFGQTWSSVMLPDRMCRHCKLSSSGKILTIVTDNNIYQENLF
jgi:hypothetical protein